MRAELKRLHRQFGMTIVYATPHELEALSMGEEIAVMRDGRVVQQGTPDDLYERPADLYVASKIGSPHINTIDVEVRGDGVALTRPLVLLAAPAVARGLGRGVADTRLTALGLADGRGSGGERLPAGAAVRAAWRRDGRISTPRNGTPLRIVPPEAQAVGKAADALPIVIDTASLRRFRRHDGSAINPIIVTTTGRKQACNGKRNWPRLPRRWHLPS